MLNKMKRSAQSGFTVLEILVVLTIMGFLLAMVAPRLAGLSDGAIGTICDTNQNRMVGYMAQYFESTSSYPNSLTNIVATDGAALATATYTVPTISDSDPENGNEVIAAEMNDRMQLQIHYLTLDEVQELIDLGITEIFNLNDYSNDTVAAERAFMEPVNLTTVSADYEVAVATSGAGFDGTNWQVATGERDLGEADWFGRIVLGFSTESGLIKDGVIANAAHCPGGLQNEDNASYNDYNIVLPRLTSTASAIAAGTMTLGTVSGDERNVTVVAYNDGDLPAAANYNIATNSELLKVRTINVAEAQEAWDFATVCPEGHMYPEDDNEFWGVDIDADGTIN